MAGELLVLFNTLVNVLLLKFTGAVTGFYVKQYKLWLAALCSALVGVMVQGSLLALLLSFVCLVGIAFSWRPRAFIVQGSWLLVSTLIVGGFLTMLQPFIVDEPFTLALFFLLASGVLIVVSKGWQHKLLATAQQDYVVGCELVMGCLQLHVRAYIDTGNECKEPLSGQPVHFIDFHEVASRLPATFCEGLRTWRVEQPTNLTMFPEEHLSRIRFVQVATVHQKPQLVLAFRVDDLRIDSQHYMGHYVVFTQNEASFPQQAEMILQVCILLTK